LADKKNSFCFYFVFALEMNKILFRSSLLVFIVLLQFTLNTVSTSNDIDDIFDDDDNDSDIIDERGLQENLMDERDVC
jgi:hypothetical protein